MKNLILLLLIVLPFNQVRAQSKHLGYINTGAISKNINCGVGEIFIIPETIILEKEKKTELTFEEQSKKQLLEIYPNPVTDYLYINTSLGIESISIYSIEGKLIKVENTKNTNKIDLSYLQKGTYMVISNELKFNPIKIIKL